MFEAPSTVSYTGEGPGSENHDNMITIQKAAVHTWVKGQLLSPHRTGTRPPGFQGYQREGLSSLERSFLDFLALCKPTQMITWPFPCQRPPVPQSTVGECLLGSLSPVTGHL